MDTDPIQYNDGGAIADGAPGTYMVTWQHTFFAPGNEEATIDVSTVTQGFDGFATKAGSENRPRGTKRGWEYEPALDGNALGQFAVAWTDYTTEPGDPEQATAIRLKYLDLHGHGKSRMITATPNSAGSLPIAPDVAVMSDGRAVVVWQELGEDGSDDAVLLRSFAADGSPETEPFVVNVTQAGAQQSPKIAVGPDDLVVVTWSSFGQDGDAGGIFGQRFSRHLEPLGSEFQINQTSTDHQGWPSPADLPGGRFMTVWKSRNQDGDGYGVIARIFSWGGEPQGDEFPVNQFTPGDQGGGIFTGEYEAASDALGNVLITWTTVGADGDAEGIAARFFSLSGPVCGDSVATGGSSCKQIAVADALEVLRSAVASSYCQPCVCDLDGSGHVSALDAELALSVAVGLPRVLQCPACTPP